MIETELGLPEITITFISNREFLADQQAHIFEIFIDAYYRPSVTHSDTAWRGVMLSDLNLGIVPYTQPFKFSLDE